MQSQGDIQKICLMKKYTEPIKISTGDQGLLVKKAIFTIFDTRNITKNKIAVMRVDFL